ncbi:Solute carrier family 35 member F5 [Zostera marina]|uniref:Solute carrier family 35 member F5 n=1 Tax=Zostera marina TaxID=29655 RepID=A0A0K9NJ93_ZOSMR|nr:Solute carrier family 35 member F5 [Zostera marina]
MVRILRERCCGGFDCSHGRRWTLGVFYVVTVAAVWIAASYIVQSVVDDGVSPFLITYICNSLFLIYIPLVEIARYFEDSIAKIWKWRPRGSDDNEPTTLVGEGFDEKRRWSRARIAKISLLICPFWFLAQLTFNYSLKYTTVTSNTILSSSSSLFTFILALVFLGEKFTWVKLISVLFCMGGTIIVSLGDSKTGPNSVAKNPVLGDILTLFSTFLYAVYISLIRVKLPDDKEGQGQPSMAQFLGFLGLFNFLIFMPVALILYFTKLDRLNQLNMQQFGIIVGKGLLDNVFSDYLWAKAIQLTTTTVATAGLTIQVPMAAVVDTLSGHNPNYLDYIGAACVVLGFVGLNFRSNKSNEPQPIDREQELEQEQEHRDNTIEVGIDVRLQTSEETSTNIIAAAAT